jgi:molybdenum cofactor cytidylyltransferase
MTAPRELRLEELNGQVAAVVLAAGQSSRMGQLKQVMPWGNRGTVIGQVIRCLREVAALSEIVVVTGRDRGIVEACVAEVLVAEPATTPSAPVRTVFNPKFAEAEMARSVEAGLNVLPASVRAALVVLGDQPQLRPEIITALLQRWQVTDAPVVAPFYQGQRGNPVLLARAVWPLVRALPDSANPRQIFQAAGRIERVDALDDTILRDLDTPEDYAREFERASRGIIDSNGL